MYKLSLKYGSADLESSVGIHSLRSPLRTGLLQHGSWLRLLYISARIVEGPIYNGRAFFFILEETDANGRVSPAPLPKHWSTGLTGNGTLGGHE